MLKKRLKKLYSSLLGLMLVIQAVMPVYAQASTDPTIVFEVDCDTIEKQLNIGFQTNPADPANGPELVVAEFDFKVEASGATTIDDLADAELIVNSAYDNVVVPSNTKSLEENAYMFKIVLGFVPPNVLNNAPDLLFLQKTNQKAFKISATSVNMIPQGESNNIYQTTPIQTYTADPSTCTPDAGDTTGTQPEEYNVLIDNFAFVPNTITIEKGETVIWENKQANVDHTVTSVGAGGLNSGTLKTGETYSKTFTDVGTFKYQCTIHPTMTGEIVVVEASTETETTQPAADEEITITLKSDKEKAKPGEKVSITATITNRKNESINWIQTSGDKVTPEVKNEKKAEEVTESIFSFSMPADGKDVGMRLTVGETTERITIKAEGETQPSTAAAPTNGTAAAAESEETLQERLERRRKEQQEAAEKAAAEAAPAENVHAAAGALTESGPAETTTIILISLSILLGWRWMRKPRFSVSPAKSQKND